MLTDLSSFKARAAEVLNLSSSPKKGSLLRHAASDPHTDHCSRATVECGTTRREENGNDDEMMEIMLLNRWKRRGQEFRKIASPLTRVSSTPRR